MKKRGAKEARLNEQTAQAVAKLKAEALEKEKRSSGCCCFCDRVRTGSACGAVIEYGAGG